MNYFYVALGVLCSASICYALGYALRIRRQRKFLDELSKRSARQTHTLQDNRGKVKQ